ncbi:hypothetical protein Tco_0301463, partial [Tanacetum coccineum]
DRRCFKLKVKRVKHIRGVAARMTRLEGVFSSNSSITLFEDMKWLIYVLKLKILLIMELFHMSLKLMQKEAIGVKDNLSSLVTQEIAAIAPQQFKAFLQNIYMKNHVLTLQPSSSSISIPGSQHQL